jgi:hypothetical protein
MDDDKTCFIIKMETESELNYLINELESLGVKSENLTETDDIYEIEKLVDNIKQTYIEEYRSLYGYGESG